MKQVSLLLLSGFLLLMACNNNSPQEKTTAANEVTAPAVSENTNTADAAHTAKNALDVLGTYKGVVPCADCEGIETTITLAAGNTYTLTLAYLGKANAAPFKKEGTWKWEGEFNIVLDGYSDGPNTYFAGENKLVQLDMAGNKIEGALADKYVLKKQ